MIRAARRRRRSLLASLAAGTLMLSATAAWAAPPHSGRVVLIEPPDSPPTARHCLTRIREELAAGGFEVSPLDPGDNTDPASLAAFMHRQQGAVAIVALVGDPEQAGSELWILDRLGLAPVIRRVPAPADDYQHLPEVLAIRTIEVLNASALKLLVESTPPAPPPAERAPVVAAPALPPAPRTPAAPPAPRPGTAYGFEAGLFLLDSVGGPGPEAVPLLRVRAALGGLLFTRITLAGLGSRPRVEDVSGSASVTQTFALAELGIALRPGRRWRPCFTLGGGAVHTDSEGYGLSPYRGLRESRWTGALDAGVGVSARLGSAVSVALELHGLLAVPHPTIRFDGVERATLGFPALLASLTMIAWP